MKITFPAIFNKVFSLYIRWRYRIDGVITLQELGLSPECSHEHAATDDYYQLMALIRKLNVGGGTIVDLGCGAGGALAVFCFFRFKRIYGVELSQRLAERAAQNFCDVSNVNICRMDAREFKEQVDFVYMFNPFPKKVVLECLANLLKRNGKLTVVYRNPKFLMDLKASEMWEYFPIQEFDSVHTKYAIFILKYRGENC